MTKQQAFDRLSVMFASVHITGWLNTNPVLNPKTFVTDFIDYLDSLNTAPIKEGT